MFWDTHEVGRVEIPRMEVPKFHAAYSVTEESDPTGRAPSDPGAKLDSGKQIAGELVLGFPHALSALVQVATFGARKYSRSGFLQVEDGERRYLDAAMRHLLKYGMGELSDEDSKLPHLWAVLWNIAAVIELQERRAKCKSATEA